MIPAHSNGMMRTFLFVLSFVGLGSTLWGQDYHEPEEILRIMEASSLDYRILEVREQVRPFTLGPTHSPSTLQRSGPSGLEIDEYALDKETLLKLKRSEELLSNERCREAETIYREALSNYPDCSLLWTLLGQSMVMQLQADSALYCLDRAIHFNFHGYMAHWYKADILFQKGEQTEAAKEIALAWVLNRNHIQVKQSLIRILAAEKRRMEDFEWNPNYNLNRKGSVVEIKYGKEWMLYSFCKALWAEEPNYHNELGGDRSEFSMTQEKECLLNAAKQYATEKRHKNPGMNTLIRAFEAKRVNEFIFMETWLRMEPIIVFAQPRESVESLADYVLQVRFPKR